MVDGDGEFGLQPYKELMPKVRTSDGFIVSWNREAIVKQLLTETKLAKDFYDMPPLSQQDAEEIAFDVEHKILNLRLKFVSGPLIRELVNNILLSRAKDKPEYSVYRNILTRVGHLSMTLTLWIWGKVTRQTRMQTSNPTLRPPQAQGRLGFRRRIPAPHAT